MTENLSIFRPPMLAVGSHKTSLGVGCVMNLMCWTKGVPAEQVDDEPAGYLDQFQSMLVTLNDSGCVHHRHHIVTGWAPQFDDHGDEDGRYFHFDGSDWVVQPDDHMCIQRHLVGLNCPTCSAELLDWAFALDNSEWLLREVSARATLLTKSALVVSEMLNLRSRYEVNKAMGSWDYRDTLQWIRDVKAGKYDTPDSVCQDGLEPHLMRIKETKVRQLMKDELSCTTLPYKQRREWEKGKKRIVQMMDELVSTYLEIGTRLGYVKPAQDFTQLVNKAIRDYHIDPSIGYDYITA